MTDTQIYYSETGLVVSVTGDMANIAISEDHRLGYSFRVCHPVTFFQDPLRNIATELNGKKAKRGDTVFILEGSDRYIEFASPLSGTIYDTETGCIRTERDAPSRKFISIHLNDPAELETLSRVPVGYSSVMKEAYELPGKMDEFDQFPSILKCLGYTGSRIFEIEKNGDEYTLYEACDGYYRETLTKDELLRLSDELRRLAELDDDVDPHFLPNHGPAS
jgi:hypothetical protein